MKTHFTNNPFSMNLKDFTDTESSSQVHYRGEVVTFNGTLIAIAGEDNRKVEVLLNNRWGQGIIPSIGNKEGLLQYFSALTILDGSLDTLFIFGK